MRSAARGRHYTVTMDYLTLLFDDQSIFDLKLTEMLEWDYIMFLKATHNSNYGDYVLRDAMV